jgi:hypothetical protein
MPPAWSATRLSEAGDTLKKLKSVKDPVELLVVVGKMPPFETLSEATTATLIDWLVWGSAAAGIAVSRTTAQMTTMTVAMRDN